MGLEGQILGRVRGGDAFNLPENREDEQIQMNNLGNLILAEALPEYTEIARLGDVWLGLGSAVNALTAAPTTTAHLALYNGEPQGTYGRSYIIISAGTIVTTAYAATVILSLFAQVCITPVAAATSLLVPKSLSGRRNYRGMGGHKASVTVTADAWHPIGSSAVDSMYGGGSVVSGNAAANIMLCKQANVYGRYLIPPGGFFGICSAVNSGTVSCTPYLVWCEAYLSLGGG